MKTIGFKGNVSILIFVDVIFLQISWSECICFLLKYSEKNDRMAPKFGEFIWFYYRCYNYDCFWKNQLDALHWSQKILAWSHFFHLSFHRFFQFSQKAYRIIKCFIYHMKELKSGYLISLKQKAWLPLKGFHALGNETRTFLTKISFLAFGVKLLLISNTESIYLF